MLTQEIVKTLTPQKVQQAFFDGEMNHLHSIKLNSQQMLFINGEILVQIAEKGVLYTEK